MTRAIDSPARSDAPLADPELRGLRSALEADRVAARVAADTGGDFEIVDPCRILYVRYKPRTSALVAYRIGLRDRAAGDVFAVHFHAKCHRHDDWDRAIGKLATRRWAPARGIANVLPAPEIDTIFYAFPNDPEMPGLRLVGDRKRLRRFLATRLVEFPNDNWRLSDSRLRSEVVRLKPERRAVLRLETRAVHRTSGEHRPVVVWLRAYAGDRAGAIERLGSALHAAYAGDDTLAVPRVLGADIGRGIVLFESLPGVTPVAAADLLRAAAAIGRDLARLHATAGIDLPLQRVADHLENAAATADALSHLAPELAARVTRIAGALRARAPRDIAVPQFVHGDFAPGQIVVDEHRIGFLDFDRAHSGDPLGDVGSFLAHLEEQRVLHGLAAAPDIGARFLHAYATAARTDLGRERILFFTLNGLLSAAIRPFRCLRPGWRTAVGTLLAASEELIS